MDKKRRYIKRQLGCLLLLAIGIGSYAQETPVLSSVDTTAIRIGEQLHYRIRVNATEGVQFPELKLDSLQKFEVVEALPIDSLKNRLEKSYLLTCFDSGQYLIPRQEVRIGTRKYLTDSLLLSVATVKVDTSKQGLFPIKAINREPKTMDDYKHWLWWLFGLLVLLAVIGYVVFRKKAAVPKAKVSIPPFQQAMERLQSLDEKSLLEENKVKPYYSELTDIVRTYIERAIHIPALESTTRELLVTMRDFNDSSDLGISAETLEELQKVLQQADLVKFAKSKPLIEEIQQDRRLSERVLHGLKPPKPPTDALD